MTSVATPEMQRLLTVAREALVGGKTDKAERALESLQDVFDRAATPTPAATDPGASVRDAALEEAAQLAETTAAAKEASSRGSLGGMFASQSAADLEAFARQCRALKSTPSLARQDGAGADREPRS